jgi:hypothetical protein
MRTGSLEKMGEGGGGLAEAHVVGETPAEAELGEELQPRQRPALIVPEFADELDRLVGLVEALVGQAGEQVAHPVGVGGAVVVAHGDRAGALAVRAAVVQARAEALVVGQAQQFDRRDHGLGRAQFGELGAFAAQFVGVDADPPVPGVQQRGADLLGPGDLRLGDLLVADHHLPLDQRLRAELLLAVVGRRRRGLAVDAHPGADQTFRADQLDAHPLQLDRGDVEEVLGDVEFQFDLGRFVFQCEVGEAGDGLDLVDGGADQLAEPVEVVRPFGDFDRRVVRVPDIVRRAPSGAVAVVDEFQTHDPRIAGVVGDQQPDPRDDDRFIGEATPVPVEFVTQLAQGAGDVVGGSGTDDVVRFGQRPEGGSQCLDLGSALSPEIGLPAVLEQERTGDAVDELGVDRGGLDAGAGGADGRHRRSERNEGGVDRLGGDRLPAGDGERAFVDDDRGDPTRGDSAAGEFGDPGEPCERVGQVRLARQFRQPDGGAHRIELHRRGVQRRPTVDVEADAPDRSVRHRRVVPAGTRAVGVEVAEPAVEPRHRCAVDAVPAPHVQRAAPPRALRDVRRPVTRHRGHPIDATDGLSHRYAKGQTPGVTLHAPRPVIRPPTSPAPAHSVK